MKVKPNMHEKYHQLEAAWKKIHIESKARGIQDGWAFLGLISPSGTSTEYNYVTRNTFVGEEKLASYLQSTSMMEGWESLLSDGELAIVKKTSEIRDLVKTEIYTTVASLWAEDRSDSKIRVFNYFDLPEGKHRPDHFAAAEKIWMPVHKARIEQGTMKGWVSAELVTPYGSAMPYQIITADFYTNVEDMLNTPFWELMTAAHPDQEVGGLFAEWEANADLVKSEIRILIDSVE